MESQRAANRRYDGGTCLGPKSTEVPAVCFAPCATIRNESGCASKTVERVGKASFVPGQEGLAFVGSPFLWQETGSTEKNEHWEGILFGGMDSRFTRTDDYRRSQVFYGGRSGDVLTLMYQVTVGNDTTPTISRVHQIDL